MARKDRSDPPNFIVKNYVGMYFAGFKYGGNAWWSFNRAEAKPLNNPKNMVFFENYYGRQDTNSRVEMIWL